MDDDDDRKREEEAESGKGGGGVGVGVVGCMDERARVVRFCFWRSRALWFWNQ